VFDHRAISALVVAASPQPRMPPCSEEVKAKA
jgi:hypothetical protein